MFSPNDKISGTYISASETGFPLRDMHYQEMSSKDFLKLYKRGNSVDEQQHIVSKLVVLSG